MASVSSNYLLFGGKYQIQYVLVILGNISIAQDQVHSKDQLSSNTYKDGMLEANGFYHETKRKKKKKKKEVWGIHS